MEVPTEPGMGFKKIIYKDALEYEFINNKIPYRREKNYQISYKGHILRHSYSADFIVYYSIMLEVKATSMIVGGYVKQTINYLRASRMNLGIIANFGEKSYVLKRVLF